jgi:hypothetical protein
MTEAPDLLALPAVISSFNGFHKRNGSFVLMNSMRVFIAEALAARIVLIALVLTLVLYVRRRKRESPEWRTRATLATVSPSCFHVVPALSASPP